MGAHCSSPGDVGSNACCTKAETISQGPSGSANGFPPISSGLDGNEPKPQLILVSDPGQDLDDEMAFIMLRHLVEQDLVDVAGIVCTLNPAFDRARLAKGTLSTLGLHQIPIGLGTEGGDVDGVHKASTFENWAKPYMPPRHSSVFEPGRGLLMRLYEAAQPKSISLVIIASLKDPALFLRDKEELFVQKTREVIIMGGAESFDENAPETILKPDSSHNQMFDKNASQYLFKKCQEMSVPLVVVSRWAAYAAMVPRSCYDELAALGSWVGCRLRNAQRASIENLWNRACATGDAREGLPPRCDRAWFLKTFCGGNPASGRGKGDTIWDLIVGFMQYDSVATLAAVPRLRKRFFSPCNVKGINGISHMVIGCSEEKHNLSDPDGLGKFLRQGFVNGLSLNNQRRVQFILVSHPSWNNLVHELLAVTVLRTLFDLGIFDCVGMIVSPGPTGVSRKSNGSPGAHVDDNSHIVEENAAEISKMLKMLGLGHIPVLIAETYREEDGKKSGADLLLELYKKVSPAGVSLVINGALGEAAAFAEKHSTEFQQKTQCVIHMGGAFPATATGPDGKPTGEVTLTPDEAAQNNKADMSAAHRFVAKACELLVPLVIVSRHAAGAVQVPRAMFDTLGKEGGAVGQKLKDCQAMCIRRLWNAINAPVDQPHLRRGLPPRCDQQWFMDTFCEGQKVDLAKGDEGVWDAVRGLNCYTLLAMLMALPPIVNRYIKGTPTTVRATVHNNIGVTKEEHGIKDDVAIRELIFQCLFSGCYLNDSRFDLEKAPQVQQNGGRLWTCKDPRDALGWLLPRKPAGHDYW
jgi:inosine-uridine nucleoside N-ribohydrolase